MKTAIRLFATTMLLIGASHGVSVSACSLDTWENVTAGATVGDPTANVSRVGGKCALKVTGSGQVVDDSPVDEITFIGRFYFFPKMLGAGSHEIFVALSDQADTGSEVFVITYDGTRIKLDASHAGGGSASAPADSKHWNLVEFSWKSGKQGQLWVNADASSAPASDTYSSGSGSVDQIRMGAVGGIGSGMAFFDDYVSRRQSPVGSLKTGDANSDDQFSSEDIDVIVNEFLFEDLGTGVVDCNLDGAINSGDLNCVVSKL